MEATALSQTATCVAVGRFNPAIVVPAWIVKEGILPDGETEIGQALGGAMLQFRMQGLMWQASLNKLEAHAESKDVDPGEFVARVLDKLPHTPIRAVGNNFAWELSEDQGRGLYPVMQCSLVAAISAPTQESLSQSVTLAVAHEGESIMRLTLDAESSQVASISFNFHRDCGSAVAGAAAARCWSADRAEARRVFERLIQQ